jgi:ribosomal protein L37AE/L43A
MRKRMRMKKTTSECPKCHHIQQRRGSLLTVKCSNCGKNYKVAKE